MSWHAAHGHTDPFAKPAKAGDVFGCLVVVKMIASDAHAGLRARLKCRFCGSMSDRVLAGVRHRPPARCRQCWRVRLGVWDRRR